MTEMADTTRTCCVFTCSGAAAGRRWIGVIHDEQKIFFTYTPNGICMAVKRFVGYLISVSRKLLPIVQSPAPLIGYISLTESPAAAIFRLTAAPPTPKSIIRAPAASALSMAGRLELYHPWQSPTPQPSIELPCSARH